MGLVALPPPCSHTRSRTPLSAELQPLLWITGTLISPHQSQFFHTHSIKPNDRLLSLFGARIHMMSAVYNHPVYTYQFKILNSTSKEQTYVIKPPNIPSPVALPVDRTFPALYTCTLAPSAAQTFTTEIISNSQGMAFDSKSPDDYFNYPPTCPCYCTQAPGWLLTLFRTPPLSNKRDIHGDFQRRILATKL